MSRFVPYFVPENNPIAKDPGEAAKDIANIFKA